MSAPDPVMEAAVEAACRAFYVSWDWDEEDPEDVAHCRREMTRAVEAARPIIAAAVRDEAGQGAE